MMSAGSLLRDRPNVLTFCFEHILHRELMKKTAQTGISSYMNLVEGLSVFHW